MAGISFEGLTFRKQVADDYDDVANKISLEQRHKIYMTRALFGRVYELSWERDARERCIVGAVMNMLQISVGVEKQLTRSTNCPTVENGKRFELADCVSTNSFPSADGRRKASSMHEINHL